MIVSAGRKHPVLRHQLDVAPIKIGSITIVHASLISTVLKPLLALRQLQDVVPTTTGIITRVIVNSILQVTDVMSPQGVVDSGGIGMSHLVPVSQMGLEMFIILRKPIHLTLMIRILTDSHMSLKRE